MAWFRSVWVALAFMASSLAAAQGGSLDPRIDAYIRGEMERERIPGLAVAIVNKKVVTARGYGLANIEHQVPVTPETMFQSGSLGKMLTATVVMLLVEDGKLSLSDPITRFLPGAPGSWRPITVRHLLTHTSGIPDYATEGFDYRKDYTYDELARIAYGMKLDFAPGSKWSYSNTGYMLLGFIIGKVSGRFYGDLLTERVFKPLGMKTARVISEVDIVPNRAASYEIVDGKLQNQGQWVSPTLNTTADGALYLSLQDWIAWDAAVGRRDILRPESWKVIFTPVKLNDGSTYPYGFGWRFEERGGSPVQQHGGSWQAFHTHLARFIGEDLTIIVLVNAEQGAPGYIADGIAALIDPKLAVTPSCDRACLEGIAEKYLAAMSAHDPSKAPIATGTRFTENGVELPLPDGLWRTAGVIGPYRLFVTDPKEGAIGFFVKVQENGAPALAATRLKVFRNQITEIETVVARLSGTIGGSPPGLIGPDKLGDTTRAQFTTALPPDKRRTREELVQLVNGYFTGLENNTGDELPSFADDCLRLENGTQTSGRPVAEGAQPGPLNFGCKEAFALGYYREDTRLRNRRVMAVDEERGLVYAGVFFDHDAVLRSYELKDGRTVNVRNTAPWTWMIHEIFQIDADGKISQVEAVLLSVPYGARPGWGTGTHMPSPQAIKDGFKEY
jgi:CubicO group peptidase (beta-lactamase class C family)